MEGTKLPNTSTNRTMDNVRNALVAAGASAGLSEAQWSSLTKALPGARIGDKIACETGELSVINQVKFKYI